MAERIAEAPRHKANADCPVSIVDFVPVIHRPSKSDHRASPRHQCASAVILFLLVWPVSAAQQFGDLSINVDAPPRNVSGSNETHHGYWEYRVTIVNRSSTRGHDVTLFAPRRAFSTGDHHLRRIERRVTVGPGATVRVGLLQPPVSLGGEGLGVAIDGRTHKASLNVATAEHIPRWGGHGGKTIAVLASQGAGDDFWRALSPTGSTHRTLAAFASEVPVGAWSRQWLGYSRYDAVAVRADEMQTMPEEVRSALLRWVECGGCLVIDGQWQPPNEWQRFGSAGSAGDAVATCYRGFGVVYVTGRDKPSGGVPEALHGRLWRAAERTASPYDHLRDVQAANKAFAVIDKLGIPVRGLFVLMLLFAFVIGPVNLIVLGRMKRRIWLLWTVPAISLCTCLVVVAYAALAEGWRGRARTETITVLDETTQRATSIGWTAYYAPITPLRGLHFSYDTELTPHVRRGGFKGGGRARTLDWTTDQHLSNGWIVARVPAHFLVRKSEALQRQRLNFSKADSGALTVTNGLGSDIRELWVADATGAIHRAGPIPAGQSASLAPHAPHPRAGGAAEKLRRRVFARDWLGEFRAVTSNPHQYLQPDTYIAVLDTAPFVEAGLGHVRQRRAKTVVYGIAKEPIHAN